MTRTADTLTITRPDDWHLHVRDGEPLFTVVPHTAAQFGRAIIMPNLRPPVTTAEQALAYKERILAAVPAGVQFEPLMTLYLTDNLPPEEIVRARELGGGMRHDGAQRLAVAHMQVPVVGAGDGDGIDGGGHGAVFSHC